MSLALKPAHASVKGYYDTLHEFGQLYIDHEGAVRSAFQTLLTKCGQKVSPKLTLVPEYRIERARSSVIVDGALVDLFRLPHGCWEAKDDSGDGVKQEIGNWPWRHDSKFRRIWLTYDSEVNLGSVSVHPVSPAFADKP